MAIKIVKNLNFPNNSDTFQINAVTLEGKTADTVITEARKGLATEDYVDSAVSDVAYIDTADNETITDVNVPSSGGGANIDVTATVGQTIIVKEVDANGKPTKWESAEYQEKTHWSESTELLPLTEVTPQFDQTVGTGVSLLPICELIAGNWYKVTFDGAEYICQASIVSLNGMNAVAIGNKFLATGENTGEPFGYAYMLADDNISYRGNFLFTTDLNPHTIQVIAEKTHKIPTKFIPTLEEMRTEMGYIIPETTIEGSSIETPVDELLVGGETYVVNWEGVDYTCECVTVIEDGMTGQFIGNALLIGGEDTGEPFVIITTLIDGNKVGVAASIDDTVTSFTFSLKGKKAAPIPVQYLTNALPYYINVTGIGTTDDPYVCSTLASEVVEAVKSGRHVVMRVCADYNGSLAAVIYFTCTFVYTQPLEDDGVAAGFAQFESYSTMGRKVFNLYPKEDGTYEVQEVKI